MIGSRETRNKHEADSAGSSEDGPDPVDANASAQSDANDDVVDAEFEEVKEDDKK